MNSPRHWIVIGALLAGLSVVTGAFAAHGLEGLLKSLYDGKTKTIAGQEFQASYKYVQDFKTAAEYQMYHALGLIALGLAASRPATHSQVIAAWCFFLGIVFFSGSLYVLVLTGQTWWGAIAPVGGTLMIVAWVAFAVGVFNRDQAGA